MLGIIGGSGLYSLFPGKEKMIRTEYGDTPVTLANVSGREVAFIARHGKGHEFPPHKVNYKAHISAMRSLDVKRIISTAMCGIISKYKPGDLVLASDFLTFLGPITFYNSFEGGIKHTDFTEPYSANLKNVLKKAAQLEKIPLKDGGIIATLPGPRFETKAEINALKKLGANLVSMTSAYETILAHEAGIEYAAIAIGTNYACGISKKPLSIEECFALIAKKENEIKRLIVRAIEIL